MFQPPAHKSGSAGQIVNELTLADYIERKKDIVPPKKLTFEEWWDISTEQLRFGEQRKLHFQECWKAAQENK